MRSHTFFHEFALRKEISGHKGHHLHTISVAIKKKKQKESAYSICMKFKVKQQQNGQIPGRKNDFKSSACKSYKVKVFCVWKIMMHASVAMRKRNTPTTLKPNSK
jgi:hypothetical protein